MGTTSRTGVASVVLGTVVVAAAYLVGVRTAAGRRIDAAVAHRAMHAGRHLRHPLHALLDPVPWLVPLAAAVLLVAALVARRPVVALTTLIMVGGASLTTEVVKALLVRPGGENTLPSGHLTVIAGLAVALVAACPARWRAAAGAVGVVVVIGAGIGTWVTAMHRPSDSVAAVGVVIALWGVRTLMCGPGAPPTRYGRTVPDEPPGTARR